jgi:carbonic anhydrase
VLYARDDRGAVDRPSRELNVLEQVTNVCRTTIVQDAWRRGQPLGVHGWIYGLQDGLLRDLGLSVTNESALLAEYGRALAAFSGGPVT